MKRIILTSLAIFLLSVPAMAQDKGAGGVGYIPGMPVPQASASASSDSASNAAASSQGSNANEGKISRVSVAGKDSMKKDEPEPVEAPAANVAYKGVTPPSRLVPENESTFTKTSANQLSWIGFLPDSSGHRVFLQTSKNTSYERLASSEDRVELLLSNTKLAVSNNTRELDMSFFQTPFAKARAMQSGSGVKVVIQLKQAAPVDIQQNDNIISITARQ